MVNNQTEMTKDLANKKIIVTREFAAPLRQVWNAWTDRKMLDEWWAPRPWKAETKTMDFRPGGHWLYCMVGPDGSKQWCRVDYKTIDPGKSFTAVDAFCDEDGNASGHFPNMQWNNRFYETDAGAKVIVEINFNSKEDLEKIIEMGFEQGFTAAHGNLDELLAAE